MTYEEARDICGTIVSAEINELCNLYRHDDAQELEEAKNLMLSAFEKQIPKKPANKKRFLSDVYIGNCPCCGGNVRNAEMFCSKCGQAQDWSERVMISGDGFDGTQKTKGGEKTMANGETAAINGERTGTTMIVMLCPKCESRQVFVVDGKEHYCTNCGEKLNEQ